MIEYKKYFIQGTTTEGKKFRPSDWAERLCCSVSMYKPKEYYCNNQISCDIYSPFAMPIILNGEQFALISEELKTIEPKAFDFIMNFAKDNDLPILQACEIKDKN